ncbi:hypothetical protein AB0H83_51485 [Dactylosporangium sp. NPDC050688]|uniref:hypothetical protein n=1 Tax=Dactylosporangium sp. NPDC050688 TaxID=3157217 RepID=UPI0033F0D191
MADNHVPAADDGNRSDLDSVQSLADFARACDRLRAGRSYAALAKTARPWPLPPATLSNLINAKTTPTRDTVITFLIACGLDGEAQRPWLAAWERVATAHQPRPAGAVRVRQARPRLLGVHAAIQIPGVAGELPPYVPRDLDADLRADLTAAATEGGFVLLMGGSSVGKTRALHEAVSDVLPEWWLLHPADTRAITAHAEASTPRTVLWLDELQRYLNPAGGLPVAVMQQVINDGTVVVATLWPDEYSMRTARPRAGQPDPYANDRELLGLTRLIEVPETFSRDEQRRANSLVGTDPRIRIALDTTDAGFTQVLAAGPALIQRWEHAPAADCYGKALITAALDAHRVGAHQPVTSEFLEAAAPAYLTPAQQATAPRDWFDYALTYATAPVHGAAACLTPVPARMGVIAGYVTADYLRQQARRTRRTAALPDLVWQILVTHHHPDDSRRLAYNAKRRGQPEHAIALYQRAAATSSDPHVNVYLAETMVSQGRVVEALQALHDSAATGDGAARQLTDMLDRQGRLEELRDRAAHGDKYAASKLAAALARQGRADELRDRAAAGDEHAAGWLAEALEKQCRVEEALQVLRVRAATGKQYRAVELADSLVRHGRIGEALQVLRDRAATGDEHAARWLADMLAEQGRVDELRDRAATGDEHAARRLADMLAEQGRVDELRDRAATGDEHAARRLADVVVDALAEQGRVDELRDRAATGDEHAARQLACVLAMDGLVDEALQVLRSPALLHALRQQAGTDEFAAGMLHDVLAKRGQFDVDKAVQILNDHSAAQVESDARVLTQGGKGDVDRALQILRRYHFTVDEYAAHLLHDVLAERAHIAKALQALRDRAAAGDEDAALQLSRVLVEDGHVDEALLVLRDSAATGKRGSAAIRLAKMLAEQGHVDEALLVLRDRDATGHSHAAISLDDLLAEHGRVDELRDRAITGHEHAARLLVNSLAKQGRIDELRHEVAAGTLYAAEALAALSEQADQDSV